MGKNTINKELTPASAPPASATPASAPTQRAKFI
jgi:hypothetical protein